MHEPVDLPGNVHPKILVVEDQEDLLRGLEINLVKEGYRVFKASTGEEGVRIVVEEGPHLVLLDVMLPGLSGIDVCREIRRRGFDVPIIFLTAKSDVIDRVVGLETGADDYVVKPFSLPELLARIRARLRRHGPGSSPGAGPAHFRLGDLEVDFERLLASRAGRPLHLTPKECEVLRMLIRHRGQAVSRTRMLNEIWGYDSSSTTRTVDTHILTLRQKIEHDPGSPRHILTCYGEGYKFVE
jgi:two-component system alkaline phosphatase synthesis response regulator PhoP